MSKPEAETFQSFLNGCNVNGLPVELADRDAIKTSLADEHFGFVMRDSIVEATNRLESQAEKISSPDLPAAMGVLGRLLSMSGVDYRRSHQGSLPSAKEWGEHVRNVRGGTIEFLLSGYWGVPLDGLKQVTRANRAFSQPHSRVQRILAALNYGIYFNPKTMADAARTLSTSPDTIASSEELEAMPHLTVTNWAIGQTVQRLYQELSLRRAGKMHVVDMCSGTGSTLATILNRLNLAWEQGNAIDGSRLSVAGLEVTPEFFEELKTNFLPMAGSLLERLEPEASQLLTEEQISQWSEASGITLIEGDAVDLVKNMNFDQLGKDDVAVITANYGWHRLPMSYKIELMRAAAKAPNAIFLVGDLRRNGSDYNLGYYNQSMNGALNSGNLGLEVEFERQGYKTLTVGENYDPEFVKQSLRQRLHRDLVEDKDGFYTVAIRGGLADDLVFGAPKASVL